jgi:hypothetical protein
VGEASLDPAAVLFKQQIQLTNVPVGTARVVFNASDFGNFLVHPLMTEAAKEAVEVGGRGMQLQQSAGVLHGSLLPKNGVDANMYKAASPP